MRRRGEKQSEAFQEGNSLVRNLRLIVRERSDVALDILLGMLDRHLLEGFLANVQKNILQGGWEEKSYISIEQS